MNRIRPLETLHGGYTLVKTCKKLNKQHIPKAIFNVHAVT